MINRERAVKNKFAIAALGSVTSITQGVYFMAVPDGGDYPFDREMVF